MLEITGSSLSMLCRVLCTCRLRWISCLWHLTAHRTAAVAASTDITSVRTVSLSSIPTITPPASTRGDHLGSVITSLRWNRSGILLLRCGLIRIRVYPASHNVMAVGGENERGLTPGTWFCHRYACLSGIAAEIQ